MRNHFKSIRSTWILGVIGFAVAGHATDGPVPVPVAHHPNIAEITLFAENPDIVTPIGIAVAPDGRVFVQENHTHKRTKDYQGPKKDRILVFEDTDGDGVSDKRSVFYEGHVYSTDLLFGPDGHLYVSTRWFIGRFPDAATEARANGDPEVLIQCKTQGDYPHNGVGGLAIDPGNPDWLSFGFGENLGEDYTFVGSDGVEYSGGAEGGSTYHCKTDGSQLKRITTGHWNAFGMAYDLDGNLFSTDNDPSSTPPNRLLHIVPGADFGFEYRYGRSGRHPLVSWYGEIPGTLGMIGTLGEAACGVIPFGPGKLLSASWTDNRVDLHPLTKKGASFEASREPFISGSDNFRPVHFSYSPDGRALYFTDWVKLSYPVHGHGKIWKVTFKEPIAQAPHPRKSKPSLLPELALEKLGSADPYVWTAAIDVLAQNPAILKAHDWKADSNPLARANYAVALKRVDPKKEASIIPELLADASANVRYVGIKWIADEGLTQYQGELDRQFDRADLKRRNLRAVVAAMAKVSGGSEGEFSPAKTLLSLALDSTKPARLRALALQSVAVNHPGLTVEKLAGLAKSAKVMIRREAIRSLALHPNEKRGPALASLAANASLPPVLRADAIAGLADFAEEHVGLLEKLAGAKNAIVTAEAARTLASGGVVWRELPAKPELDDVPAWVRLVAEAPGKPDTSLGRRLFFHSRLGTCHRCHLFDGRGLEVGPDLTSLHKQDGIDRTWLLTHILDPNAEVAPYFRPQHITTKDGGSYLGFILGKEGAAQAYVGTDGKKFKIRKVDVVRREEIPVSLMPPALIHNMSASEIRDLLAYLLNGGE
jgi:hypothetical protein